MGFIYSLSNKTVHPLPVMIFGPGPPSRNVLVEVGTEYLGVRHHKESLRREMECLVPDSLSSVSAEPVLLTTRREISCNEMISLD